MSYILLVEDAVSDAALSLYALKRAQLVPDVVLAMSGKAALQLLAVDPLPILVVLDLALPDIDGAAVLYRIRDDPHTKLLPVITLTGSEDDTALLASLGANYYIRKTADVDFLIKALQEVFVKLGC